VAVSGIWSVHVEAEVPIAYYWRIRYTSKFAGSKKAIAAIPAHPPG
jgi:hypothetical protein